MHGIPCPRRQNFQTHVKEKGVCCVLWLRPFLWFKGAEAHSDQFKKTVSYWNIC